MTRFTQARKNRFPPQVRTSKTDEGFKYVVYCTEYGVITSRNGYKTRNNAVTAGKVAITELRRLLV